MKAGYFLANFEGAVRTVTCAASRGRRGTGHQVPDEKDPPPFYPKAENSSEMRRKH